MKSRFRNPVGPGKKAEFPRRLFLSVVGLNTLLFGTFRPTKVLAHVVADTEIDQPHTSDDMAFIQRAFKMRQLALSYGDQGYGAIVVMDGKIIGQSWSRVALDYDPTGHAEMSAIRDAARRQQVQHLGGSVLYSSSRPCAMCQAAANWSGVQQMVYGRNATKGGAPKLC